jgi:hypothetical protein
MIDREKPEYSDKSLSQCHLFLHESICTGLGLGPLLRIKRQANNRLCHGTAPC